MPVERHRAAGNPSKKNLPAAPMAGVGIPAATKLPRAPRRLDVNGRRAWRAIWAGARSWLSPQLDAIAVESAAWDYQLACKLRDDLSSGEIPKWTSNEAGRLFAHPAVAQLASLEARIVAWSAQLGLNPSDRARLGLAQVRVQDEDDELTRRRADRARELREQVEAARMTAGLGPGE